MGQTLMPIIISILIVTGKVIVFSKLGYTILMLLICKKRFLSTIFRIIRFIQEMGQTWILIVITVLFVIGTTIVFSILGYMILMAWICKKSFLSTIFPIIKVHPWNETNLDTHHNLHSFCYWHCNHVLRNGIRDMMLWIYKKSFSFYHFPYNQNSSEKWDKLGYS